MTPGFRQVWSKLNDKGSLKRIVELDLYVAAQFNDPDFYGDNEYHRLAEPGSPHYGERGCEYVPGARMAWTPVDDISFGARAEYDSDANKVAFASVGWSHRLSDKFKYNVSYVMRDHRYWDFSSYPHSDSYRVSDELNYAHMRIITLSFEHEVFDWLVWSPHLRWDARDGDLDTVGFWVDYRTDCLGFRLLCEYENEFRTIDGHLWGDDFSVGFYIYLRAFGSEGIFSTR